MKSSQKKKDEKDHNTASGGVQESGRYDHWHILLLLFLVSSFYFLIFGSHVFFYQYNQGLFIYSGDYFSQFARKPGGVLEYAGNFIAQGYNSPLSGSLLFSALITLTAIVFYRINKILYGKGPLLMAFTVIPSCLLIMFSSNFNFSNFYTLGFLLVSIYFLLLIKAVRRPLVLFLIFLFPLFYYIAGAYTWILAGMFIIYSLVNRKIIYPALLLFVAFLTSVIFRKFLFLQPLDVLLSYPLPPVGLFRYPVVIYILYGLIVIYPFLLRISSFIKIKESEIRSISNYTVIFLFSITVFSLSRFHNPEISSLFKLEKFFYQRDWNNVIRYQEQMQIKNVVAQYYYNTALAEKGQLCERIFFSRQDFGTGSLMVQWDSKLNINQIFRGAYFFYAAGLINEAHRWAFESMVSQGFRPENIKLLIKTELISGHYKIAGKYINVLKKTLNYRALALKYEKMLGNHDLIASDPELGNKIRLLPGKDFLVSLKDQQDNLLLLFRSNPGNRAAFEYMMAWYMLERNAENVCDEIAGMKQMGYDRIPRHVEEAAVYVHAYSGEYPDLGGLTISNETLARFSQYKTPQSRQGSDFDKFRKVFGDTFWFYLDF